MGYISDQSKGRYDIPPQVYRVRSSIHYSSWSSCRSLHYNFPPLAVCLPAGMTDGAKALRMQRRARTNLNETNQLRHDVCRLVKMFTTGSLDLTMSASSNTSVLGFTKGSLTSSASITEHADRTHLFGTAHALVPWNPFCWGKEHLHISIWGCILSHNRTDKSAEIDYLEAAVIASKPHR